MHEAYVLQTFFVVFNANDQLQACTFSRFIETHQRWSQDKNQRVRTCCESGGFFLRDFILAHKYANCMKLFMKKAHCLLKPCAKKVHYIAGGSICVALMVASFSVSPAEPQTEMLRSLCTVFGLHQTYNFTFKPRSSI